MTISRDSMRYQYDALDRLVTCSPSEQASTQRFYLKNRLATEIQSPVQWSIFQQEDQLLAQQQRQGDTGKTRLLVTDQQRSVLNVIDATRTPFLAYTPYGHRPLENGLLSLLGFNGERADSITGHYLLGNGYRAFNPMLMRFNSPDNRSPFGDGGVNAYAYCLGDPVNREDSTGQSSMFGRFFGRIGRRALQVVRGKPNTGPKMKPVNFKKVAPETYVFDSAYDGGTQFNVITHGYSRTNPRHGGMHLNSPGGGAAWTPEEFVDNLYSAGVMSSDYKRINIMTCYGADGGNRSFAQQVANITNIPTKSYFGDSSFGSVSIDDAIQWIRVNRDSKSAGVPGYKYKSAIFKPVQPKR
jgi:RHS repeat-associated protein